MAVAPAMATMPSAKERRVQGPEKAEPLVVAYARRGQVRHQHAARGRDEVAQTGAVLVGEHGRLPRQAEEIGERNENRQGEHRLAAHARHRNVNRGVHRHHADGREPNRQSGERRDQPVHDRIDDAALLEHHVDRARKPDEQRGKGHRPEALDERVRGAAYA